MKYSILLFGVSEQNAYAHVETELFVLEFIKNLQICKYASPWGGGAPLHHICAVFLSAMKRVLLLKSWRRRIWGNTYCTNKEMTKNHHQWSIWLHSAQYTPGVAAYPDFWTRPWSWLWWIGRKSNGRGWYMCESATQRHCLCLCLCLCLFACVCQSIKWK